MMSISWLFFDLGYTLINENAAHKARIENAVKIINTYNKNICYDDIYYGMIDASKNYEPPFKTITEKLGLTQKIPYQKELEVLYPEAIPLIKDLHKRYKIGIIANQSPGTEQRLQSWGILDYIDVVVSSAEEGVEKPDLRIFEIAFDKSGCSPENAIMIGDRLDNDIHPAKKSGMKTIWIRQGFGGFQEPRSDEYKADYIVNSLSEINKLLNTESNEGTKQCRTQ